MASTWSSLKIELLETGANSGTWGTATNVNLGDAVLGEAITGQATVDFATDADVTITLTDSATSQSARNLRLNITESSSGVGSVRNLILGSGCQIEKFYLINNTGTGAKTVKNTSGTGISVPAGKATLVFNNGTNVVDAASYFTSLTLGSALPIASGGTGSTSTTFVNLASNVTGLLPIANGGTATATPALVQGSGVTITGTWPNQTINATGTGGTVTSVAVSGGTTGLTTSGGPITTSGTVTLAGTVATTNGGTGLTSFTSGGVVYASSTSALATGSALTWSGTSLGLAGTTSAITNILTATTAAIYTQYSNSGSNFYVGKDGSVSAFGTTAYASILYEAGNNPMVFFTSAAEKMRITGAGNVGIGTSSPGSTLDVYGAIRTTLAADTSYFGLFTNTGGATQVDARGSGATLQLLTAGATRFLVGTSGELGIGGATYGTAGQVLTSGGSGAAPTWTSIAGGDATNNIGYLNIPQNSQSAAYTLVLADAGKHIFHPVGDNNARTFTIPANSSVAYPIGTAITFINMAVANVTIAITTDTLTLSPAGTTGSRTLATNGSATCIKITSTSWLISGSGLT